MDSDKDLEAEISGVYLLDGHYFTVSVENGMVVARNEAGNKVPPAEVTWEGKKVVGLEP